MAEFKKFPVVRHLRWLYLRWWIWQHGRYWLKMSGKGTGKPSKRGYALLDSIWRGEA